MVTYSTTTTAALYNTRFSNLNAPSYITFGLTGRSASVQFNNLLPFSTYVNAAMAAKSGVQTIAAALTSCAAPLYATGQVNITAALGVSLGIPGMTCITSAQNACNMGTSGCYAAVTVMSNVANSVFYRNGGAELFPP